MSDVAPDAPPPIEPRENSASGIAAAVRSGELDPVAVVDAYLGHIERADSDIGAFQLVRAERARDEAAALTSRQDLAALPLAGVPVAIKDNIDVAGEPTRNGSVATSETPAPADHEIVRRLRAAGAIVIGKTRVPELCTFGATDSVFRTTRNPWDLRRTPGGSSGGSAAAVAAGMVPVAHGNDGMGSIRIPSGCCGVFGIKPGAGVAPADVGSTDWYGLSENGAIACTVDDAALLLGVMAGRDDLCRVDPPAGPLRIAISSKPPMVGLPVEREIEAAVTEIAQLLARQRHHVERADPPYTIRHGAAALWRWFAGVDDDAGIIGRGRVEPRNQRHAALGRAAKRLGWVGPHGRAAWRARLAPFFGRFDLLLTPALAQLPIDAAPWGRRSWSANVVANARYAPFAAPWNLAGFPAAAIPAGLHSTGLPLAVQAVAPAGGEALVLAVATQVENVKPWPRHAPRRVP